MTIDAVSGAHNRLPGLHRTVSAVALAAILAPLSLAPMGAHAQTTQTAAAKERPDFTVEEVTVNARRRTENAQTTPVAVTAIGPSQLARIGAVDLRDLAGRAPNLVVDAVNAGPSAAAISIRGISFEDIEKSFDPAVGVLIDGVYIGTNTGQLADTFDVQSMEILAGPQGTLFGRNTTAGVINIKRSRPTGEWGGKLQATFGEYGRREGNVVLNLPSLNGQFATKLFYSYRNTDGFIKNVTRNVTEGQYEVQRFGGTGLWTPSDTFDLAVTIEHNQERGETAQASLSSSTDIICGLLSNVGVLPAALGKPPFAAPAAECNRNTRNDLYTSYSNLRGPVSNDENDVTAEANWRLGSVKLTSVTGWRHNKESVTQDFDASSINFFNTLRNQTYDQVSEELRAAGNATSSIDYVAGVYYFDSNYRLNQRTNFGPLLQILGQPAIQTQNVYHTSKSYAAFGDVNWAFMDRWRLTFGGRYTKDEKSLDNQYATAFHTNASHSWSEFTPKAGVDYRVTDDALVYFSYSRGFRSGGYNGRAATIFSSTTPYNPETVDAYEVGAKTEWLNKRLVANVAVFQTDYNNKQEEQVVAVASGGANAQETIVANAASARIQGFEGQLIATPTAGLTLRGTLGLLDAKYLSFKKGTVNLATLNMRRTPDVTASVGADYRWDTSIGELTLASDFRYVSSYDTTISQDPIIPTINDRRAHAQAQRDLTASLGWVRETSAGRFRATVFGRNLLDQHILAAALPVAGLFTFGTPRPPRTFGVTLGFDF